MAKKDPLVVRLAKLDSCAVSDAMDKLGYKGTVTGIVPLSSKRRIAGRVHTEKMVAKEKATPRSGPPVHAGVAAIEACARGDVIVVEQRSGIDAGSWGGLLSVAAKKRGVAAAIADGPVRDIDEARAIKFPVFGRSGTARTARNRIVEEATDVPVTIGDVSVSPGDYVIADATAVVFIPQGEIQKVLEAAEAIAARESAMAKAIRSGKPLREVLGADYEHMLKK